MVVGWGCMAEFNTTPGYVCPHDISNASSMWVGLVLGLILLVGLL